ncbi:hypothetical protein E8E12_000849 [Didymella heteroderae]|uniref:Uncharacterized protein n=1 Tax=Didymella heteroderae TaxID=1769908 RepID=A0A9P4WQT4_9PLEO|nr:hypothetical protein E8E12_000849 [Didymella heteroderae]
MMNRLPEHGAYAFIPYQASSLPSTSPASDAPSFKIKHTSTWTYCGPLLSPSQLPSSLHTWSTAATSSPSALLRRLIPLLTFLHSFLISAGVHHYWLTLRATTPTHEYDTPRWHVDDDFFAAFPSAAPGDSKANGQDKGSKTTGKKYSDGHGGWKLCTTLLGPSTLFLPICLNATALSTLRAVKQVEAEKRSHVCTSIRCGGCFDTGLAVRCTLSSLFAFSEAVQAEDGEIAFFRTGEAQGAVHSEPRCDVDRVFVNVVPGTEEDLRTLMGQFGMGFPRAWSLGVGWDVGDGLDGLGGMAVADTRESVVSEV